MTELQKLCRYWNKDMRMVWQEHRKAIRRYGLDETFQKTLYPTLESWVDAWADSLAGRWQLLRFSLTYEETATLKKMLHKICLGEK